MKNTLLKSINVIRSEIIYILFLTLISLMPNTVINLAFRMIFLSLAILLQVIIFSRGAQIVKRGSANNSYLTDIKKYFLKFLVLKFILSLPLILLYLIGLSSAIWIGSLIINVITIYVFPFFFLIEVSTVSIPAGIQYLLKHFKDNVLLVLLVICNTILKISYTIISNNILAKSTQLCIKLPIVYIFNFLAICITLCIYYSACEILIKKEKT